MTSRPEHSRSTPFLPLRSQIDRRRLITIAGAGLASSVIGLRSALAQDGTADATPPAIQSSSTGEMPTYGGSRSGPVGSQPAQTSSASRTMPVSISVANAQIQAEIEPLQIVNGTMENPTGPWIVSWYQETAELGEVGNVVMAGHVDYWNVGPAVFYYVRDLVAGDEIVVTGANQSTFTYAVETNDTYGLEDLTNGLISELVAPTESQMLTLITCGGEFDYENGEYLSRTVVRAALVPVSVDDASTPEG
ncbi:MAG: class F sortase [Thermomicrobiales bacterium]